MPNIVEEEAVADATSEDKKNRLNDSSVTFIALYLLMSVVISADLQNFCENTRKLDLQSAGSSPNLTYTKISALDAIRIL